MSEYEVEQKYRIKNPAVFRRELKKNGAKKRHAGKEFNELYDLGDMLLKNGRVLRLRHYGAEEGILTYKGKREKGRHKKRLEIETPVDQKKVRTILKLLGYTLKAVYNKYREEYSLGRAVVTLDHMPKLGWFAEIEAPSRLIAKTEKLLLLGPEDKEEKSYVEMQMSLEGKRYPWKVHRSKLNS